MDARRSRTPWICLFALSSLLCATPAQDACDSALVSNLPPSAFRSSSQLSASHAPVFAKLNRRDGAGGWSPLTSDSSQWLEVDLGERTTITAVSTQGRYGSSDWLTSYLLMFSDTGHNWKQHRLEDSMGSFSGNINADSVVQHKLQQSAIARFLRLLPVGRNPGGRIGLRLEVYGCPYTSDVMSLDGEGGIVAYSWSGVSRSSSSEEEKENEEEVSLKFKSLKNCGTLLHAKGTWGLGLSVELKAGKFVMATTGEQQQQAWTSSPGRRHVASLGSLLDDQQWHLVAVECHAARCNVTVDQHRETVDLPPRFHHWHIQQLSVGGIPNIPDSRFRGCLENFAYNQHNLIEMARRGDRRVTVTGNVTFACAHQTLAVAATFPGPQGFLQLPGAGVADLLPAGGVSVGLQFRTWNREGLLLTFQLPRQGGIIWVYLSDTRLRLRVQKAGNVLLELKAGSGLDDGQWHSVDLKSRRGHLSISVDKDEMAQSSPSFIIAVEKDLFFGGCPVEDKRREDCRNPFTAFQGCLRQLTVDQQQVDLILVHQRMLGNYSDLMIDTCGIMDRCSPSRCEHGGRCTQTWTHFHCNCSDSGYGGATCHSSVYEQSCEAYKHNGNTSGYFYIDVDGSGPIKPQLVYCNMTEENTWMEIRHNNTELTTLSPSSGEHQHLVQLDYSASEEQLLAVIGQSDHCQQEMAYHCRKSRLLNTPEGSPLSWWIGGAAPGGRQNYWAGGQPGSQQCACGLQGDCLDPKRYCNCDADSAERAEDTGLLIHKESLPVRSLILGDVRRTGSEAAYRVGPLRCHGDKNFWNAAFFATETSYLHFPTFHGELSADISFLFKTGAPSGVFLENLGIRDFIRIELSSPTRVLFSFDVGNGPLEVYVNSSSPLNDERWHRVRVERNVKEACLRLDAMPTATRQAPADGHIHLQLNSQLFIGGTASRQKGFRGCIRSLQLNGATLDLEERARITPGVQPGCPGHCDSYGALCQNHGRCVERNNGFHCDCDESAYDGVFCHTDVSAVFKPTTSIRYAFEMEASERGGGNVSAKPPSPSSILSDVSLRAENVSLSFRTSQSPALLLYVSSYQREYLALLINKHDKLEVRYKLHSSKEAEVLRSQAKGLADGRLHTVVVSRVMDAVSLQVDQRTSEVFNLTSDGEFSGIRSLLLGKVQESDDVDPDLVRLSTLGFSGCLSVVRFNSISPLKEALLRLHGGTVDVSGPLVRSNCGSPATSNSYATHNTPRLSDPSGSGQPLVNAMRTDSALIGGVIAVIIFVTLAGLAVVAKFVYRRKETYQNQEVKGSQQEESQDLPFECQTDSHNALGQSPKEYFI
ncbi:contactin-associated protein-like 4 isoform X1 [Phyllopteryx taeniolatus]|uniref:contactin-associated protein-like 4 isoform X1 n=1 Tax=Phyllopteryx taeniolatus TaxID=161469 RepID=UPI002AD260CC|nr:contactin-associated protein-like 4 isoform X1 [Phyllopteryx taeniolatus]